MKFRAYKHGISSLQTRNFEFQTQNFELQTRNFEFTNTIFSSLQTRNFEFVTNMKFRVYKHEISSLQT